MALFGALLTTKAAAGGGRHNVGHGDDVVGFGHGAPQELGLADGAVARVLGASHLACARWKRGWGEGRLEGR